MCHIWKMRFWMVCTSRRRQRAVKNALDDGIPPAARTGGLYIRHNKCVSCKFCRCLLPINKYGRLIYCLCVFKCCGILYTQGTYYAFQTWNEQHWLVRCPKPILCSPSTGVTTLQIFISVTQKQLCCSLRSLLVNFPTNWILFLAIVC